MGATAKRTSSGACQLRSSLPGLPDDSFGCGRRDRLLISLIKRPRWFIIIADNLYQPEFQLYQATLSTQHIEFQLL